MVDKFRPYEIVSDFCSMALDIASGMAYLHSKTAIHRDLKSTNILLVVDFGLLG